VPQNLADIAAQMMTPGKGILATDESGGTIAKRFEAIGLAATETSRRDYRELFYRAGETMNSYISGVILYDETIRQSSDDGTSLVDLITAAGAVPGIKVDTGAKPLALAAGESITEGLDGLRDRLAEYHELGARFAKWRAVITIGQGRPSENCIQANTAALARYAALCQEAGLVPIVEPEVMMDGADAVHDINTCGQVTERVLAALFAQLDLAGVALPGTILKPNMVVAATLSPVQPSASEVAEATVRVLKSVVPAELGGIAFLSGGQSDERASEHLSLINRDNQLPWPVTFSYGRALQAAAIRAWSGNPDNTVAAQRAFAHRARMNGLAAQGRWSQEIEKNPG
jgi:fructose-bisphosphate aldolase class I